MTISVRATDVRTRRAQGLVGLPVEQNYLDRRRTVVNKTPQAKQVSTILVNTATADYEYINTINSVEISYTAPSGAPSVSTVAAGIAAAIEAEPAVGGQVRVTVDTATITITGALSGTSFTITSDDDGAKTTVATGTSAASADAVPFGRAVIATDYDTPEAGLVGGLAKSTLFTAQVETLTVTYAAGEYYSVTLDMLDGSTPLVAGPVLADTDSTTTATAIYNAINAIMPAVSVVATNPSAGVVVLTAELAGKGFQVSVGLATGTIARLALVHTTARSPVTDVRLALMGVAEHAYDEEVSTVGGTSVSYPANAGVKVFSFGKIWVANSQSPTYGAAVYVELGSTDSGKFYTTSSSTRVLLPSSIARWERYAESTDDAIAVLNINAAA